jgi:hypothetical protein
VSEQPKNDQVEPDATVQQATRDEEQREAQARHEADRPPTDDEESRAERSSSDPGVAAHEREMGRIGADVKGEGQID